MKLAGSLGVTILVMLATVPDPVRAAGSSVDATDTPSAPDARTEKLARLAQGAMRTFRFKATPAAFKDIRLAFPGGADRALSSWRGKTLLVNFWASWCPPCREELPKLGQLRTAVGEADFDVVAVSVDKSAADAQHFLQDLGLTSLTLASDPGGAIAASVGATGLPTSILIDPAGRELGRLQGSADWDSEDAILLLKAMTIDGRGPH